MTWNKQNAVTALEAEAIGYWLEDHWTLVRMRAGDHVFENQFNAVFLQLCPILSSLSCRILFSTTDSYLRRERARRPVFLSPFRTIIQS